ncbi:MAG TPA: tRNA lysidine(34) synthetase TilS [Dyadobacter sp.]|nr:tRNA lysidine(34) synthetase TilS [Dyadobacter sp.]
MNTRPTLLTVSGGVDSVVMAHLFQSAGFKAGIAHCNFGLRGADSDGDEAFVKDLAERYHFTFHVNNFKTKAYAREHGISTQMAARELRYAWFDEVRDDHYGWIATAHHANDALETVLLNLTRGTGIAGLHGIHPAKGNLLRPMLFADKEEILDYAREHGLTWREDVSNDSVDYKRNLIRKEVIPVLKQLNPSLESTFRITSQKMRSADALLTEYLEEWKEDLVLKESGELRIAKGKLTGQHAAYLLWSVIEESGFSFVQAKQIVRSLDGNPGALFYSDSHQLLVERDHLILRSKLPVREDYEAYINGIGEFNFQGGRVEVTEATGEVNPRGERNVLYLKQEGLQFPLTLRNWKHGDIFCPFGMKGRRKKVSDVLIDARFSRFEKEKVKVLTDAHGEILWLVGIRSDERQRITADAGRLLKCEYHEGI